MLPGPHVIIAQVKIYKSFDTGNAQSYSWYRMPCVGSFEAEAGRKYLVTGTAEKEGFGVLSVSLSLSMSITDVRSPGVELGDATCYP